MRRARCVLAVFAISAGSLTLLHARETSVVGQLLPTAGGDFGALMARVGQRVQEYYDRLTSIMCLETVIQQELRFNLKPSGKPRETVYDLIVVREPSAEGEEDPDVKVERTLKFVNGRPVRKRETPECTDPKSVATEPLTFLRPKYQSRFRFSRAGSKLAGGPAGAVAIDFEQLRPDPVDVKWNNECFNATGGGVRGRIWLNPDNYNVIRLETALDKPFRVPLPPRLMAYAFPIRVERHRSVVDFQLVQFRDPDEIVLLPHTIETVTVFRGAPSLRTRQTFSDFKRFLSEAKIRGVS